MKSQLQNLNKRTPQPPNIRGCSDKSSTVSLHLTRLGALPNYSTKFSNLFQSGREFMRSAVNGDQVGELPTSGATYVPLAQPGPELKTVNFQVVGSNPTRYLFMEDSSAWAETCLENKGAIERSGFNSCVFRHFGHLAKKVMHQAATLICGSAHLPMFSNYLKDKIMNTIREKSLLAKTKHHRVEAEESRQQSFKLK